jgi:hypothetical protein
MSLLTTMRCVLSYEGDDDNLMTLCICSRHLDDVLIDDLHRRETGAQKCKWQRIVDITLYWRRILQKRLWRHTVDATITHLRMISCWYIISPFCAFLNSGSTRHWCHIWWSSCFHRSCEIVAPCAVMSEIETIMRTSHLANEAESIKYCPELLCSHGVVRFPGDLSGLTLMFFPMPCIKKRFACEVFALPMMITTIAVTRIVSQFNLWLLQLLQRLLLVCIALSIQHLS